MKKTWERDLLDHLVFLVIRNAELAPSEDDVRDELRREFSPFLDDELAGRPRDEVPRRSDALD
jgi:hypothetical protein